MSSNGDIVIARNFPLFIELKHQGIWLTDTNGIHHASLDESVGKNSIMFTPDCLLYVYKLALRHLLLSTKTITPQNIDPANLVPHMVVRKSVSDPFSKYNSVQNRKIRIDESMISIRNDFMLIEIDEQQDLHFTLIYAKGIKKKIDLLLALKTVIESLNANPETISTYSQLKYFGADLAQYWYDVPSSFPLQIIPPPGYTAQPAQPTATYKTTAAGSIID